jgi:hypothetical protein
MQTVGSINAPTGGAGAVSTTAGPSLGNAPGPFNISSSSYSQTQGVVTVTGVASAGAPARTLFVVVTYATNTGPPPTTESLASVAFIINTIPGVAAAVNVSATGAPGATTYFATYAGFLPNTYAWQANTAQGSAYTLANPLTNSAGVNQAPSGVSSGIVGVANTDSDAYFAGQLGATAGGSIYAGGKHYVFGATQSFSPGWPNDAFKLPVGNLAIGQLEISLKQGWYPILNGQAIGVSIDATSGCFVADTTQTACATIIDQAQGVGLNTAYAPNPGDTFARIRVKFYASAIVA